MKAVRFGIGKLNAVFSQVSLLIFLLIYRCNIYRNFHNRDKVQQCIEIIPIRQRLHITQYKECSAFNFQASKLQCSFYKLVQIYYRQIRGGLNFCACTIKAIRKIYLSSGSKLRLFVACSITRIQSRAC